MADTPRKFTVSTTAAVASPPVLGAYDATALPVEATASSCRAGVRALGGWTVSSTHGTIYAEAAVEHTTKRLCELAGCNVGLPEMPYTSSLSLRHEPSGFTLDFAAAPAMEAWAREQLSFRTAAAQGGGGGVRPMLKVGPSAKWAKGKAEGASKAEGVGSSANPASTPAAVVRDGGDDEHDWTFYTEWSGEASLTGPPMAAQTEGKPEGGGGGGAEESAREGRTPVVWSPSSSSGLDLALLTDTSVPILFFDEVALYEDELHDFGDMSLVAKVRVMPSCWFLLLRCYVRVDSVALRSVEHRFFHKQGSGVVHCEVTRRFAAWDQLRALGLSTDPRDHRDPNQTVPRLPLVSQEATTTNESGGYTGGSMPPFATFTLPGATISPAPVAAAAGPSLAEPAPALEVESAAGVAAAPPPRRALWQSSDMKAWVKSSTYKELVRFVRMLSDASVGTPNSGGAAHAGGPGIDAVLGLLEHVQRMVGSAPPLAGATRFGNAAFRTWHADVRAQAPQLIASLLKKARPPVNGEPGTGPSPMPPAAAAAEGAGWAYAAELGAYLCGCFGDPTRLDYGTGHEVNLLALLYCLAKVGVLEQRDLPSMATAVVAAYMDTVRLLQRTYSLEPAGSHGVWGLDDYHCLPFLLGAAQLSSSSSLSSSPDRLSSPGCVLDDELLEQATNRRRWHYLAAVHQVRQVKTGAPFSETSPVLHALAQLPDWRRVHAGLVRTFEDEVLGKFPVIQHFRFGRLLPATWEVAPPAPETTASATGTAFEVATAAPWVTKVPVTAAGKSLGDPPAPLPTSAGTGRCPSVPAVESTAGRAEGPAVQRTAV